MQKKPPCTEFCKSSAIRTYARISGKLSRRVGMKENALWVLETMVFHDQ